MKRFETSANENFAKGFFQENFPNNINEIELTSKSDFFELFISKTPKCRLPIPQTFVFQDGKFILWLFHHKGVIKMKKSSKLDLKILYNELNEETRLTAEEMAGSTMSPNKHLNEMLMLNSKPEIAVARTTSLETIFINPYELKKLLEDRVYDLRLLQEIISPMKLPENTINSDRKKKFWKDNNKQKDLETLYCKYTSNSGIGNYVIYRKSLKNNQDSKDLHYLKTLHQGTNYNNLDHTRGMTLDYLFNVTQIALKEEKNGEEAHHEFSLKKHYANKKTCKLYIKSMDNIVNQIIQGLTNELIQYWQHVYGFKIQTLLTKFLHDSTNHNCYYLGTKRLIILKKPPFNEILDEYDSSLRTQDIQNLQITKEIKLKITPIPYKSIEKLRPKGTIQVLSQKLLSKMSIELCNGDFCKYDFLESEKERLKDVKPDYLEQINMNHNQRVLGSEFGIKQPFAIVNKTLIDVRSKWAKIIELLRKQRIIPPIKQIKDPMDINFSSDLSKILYPPGSPKRTWTLKPSDLYRKVKLCGRCFQIYSFISRSGVISDSGNKTNKWSHSEKKFQKNAKESNNILPTTPLIVKNKKPISRTYRDYEMPALERKNSQFSLDRLERTPSVIENQIGKHLIKQNTTQKTQFLDSTRLNLGLIVNHDTPLSKINIATVSQELKNFGITQRQSKSTSEINIGNHEAELINFGSFEEEENQNSNIKRAKNSFQKISNPFLNNNLEVIIKKRESLSEKLLLNLSKNFDKKKSKLMDFYEIRKRILTLTQQKREIETSSIFHFKNLSHLRLLPDYRINIPKLCLHQDRHQCKKRLYELSFETLLELLMRKENHTNYKPEKLFALYGVPDLEKRVKVFVYNEFTAIPYIIVNSNKKRKNEHMQSANRENNFKHNVRLQKNPICLVVHDFFHNFLEYIAFYQKLANNFFNKTFILFNFPGQAFTIYNEQEYFNNVSISNLIDSLLYHLNEKKYISLDYETFKMIGLGYGGLILSYFLGSFEDAISFNSGLFINSFAFLDEITFSTLKTVIETFESSPEELPELAFDYYWRLTCSRRASDLKSLKEKYNKNPLKRQAMDYILKGCFQCVNCSKKIQSCKMPLFIIHSLQNSLIRVSQADIFNKLREEQSGMSFGLKLRKCAYIDGGHDVIEENIQDYERIVLDFLVEEGEEKN